MTDEEIKALTPQQQGSEMFRLLQEATKHMKLHDRIKAQCGEEALLVHIKLVRAYLKENT
jgi:hypothetical protein